MSRTDKSYHIAIDARQLGSQQSSGIGVVTEELIKGLVQIDHYNRYTALTSLQKTSSISNVASNLDNQAVPYAPQSLGEQLLYPDVLARGDYDLIHYTNFNSPIFFRKAKSIVTIYDLTPWLYPNSPRQRNWICQQLYRFILKRSCNNASRIIAVSHGTKVDIVKYIKVDPAKVDVVYSGVPQHIQASESGRDASQILAKYKIRPPYFLYVGQWRKHKNLVSLIRAFSIFNSRYRDFRLVIVGRPDPLAPEVPKVIRELNLTDRVVLAGYIPDRDMSPIYKHAQAFIFPSLYEGFGIPPLEAMASGTPVLSSNASVMPEVLGDAALFFNPLDIENIVQAMYKLVGSPGLRKELISKGYHQSQKYSFAQTARETLAVYMKVLGQ